MANKKIVAFHRDQEGHWVADLACGHAQHQRHNPPFQERDWVQSEAGRSSHLGSSLDCLFCNMPSLPSSVALYRQTGEYNQDSVPKALLNEHTTKEGTWGRIVVAEGLLLYSVGPESWVLRAGVAGIIRPLQAHKVTPQGPVRFHVEFLKEADPVSRGE